MMFRFGFMAAMVVAALIAAPAKAQAAGPDGIWLTQAGDAKVRVSKCGAGICGVVVWLRDPIDSATGKAQVDDKNPNPALTRRPIIGRCRNAGLGFLSSTCGLPVAGLVGSRSQTTTPQIPAPHLLTRTLASPACVSQMPDGSPAVCARAGDALGNTNKSATKWRLPESIFSS